MNVLNLALKRSVECQQRQEMQSLGHFLGICSGNYLELSEERDVIQGK
jgi:glutamine amidotransferase-like uncharacterized protein